MDDLPSAVRDLLDDANPAIVATSGGVDRPQLSVVWIERRGNDLAFFCEADSVKARNLAAHPTVVVIVMDPERTFEPGAQCHVRISGTTSLESLSDTSFPDRLAKRYMGVDRFPHEGDYVSVEVTTTSWSGVGPFPRTTHGWGT